MELPSFLKKNERKDRCSNSTLLFAICLKVAIAELIMQSVEQHQSTCRSVFLVGFIKGTVTLFVFTYNLMKSDLLRK